MTVGEAPRNDYLLPSLRGSVTTEAVSRDRHARLRLARDDSDRLLRFARNDGMERDRDDAT